MSDVLRFFYKHNWKPIFTSLMIALYGRTKRRAGLLFKEINMRCGRAFVFPYCPLRTVIAHESLKEGTEPWPGWFCVCFPQRLTSPYSPGSCFLGLSSACGVALLNRAPKHLVFCGSPCRVWAMKAFVTLIFKMTGVRAIIGVKGQDLLLLLVLFSGRCSRVFSGNRII